MRLYRQIVTVFLVFVVFLGGSISVFARGGLVIRDSETEVLLKEYAADIFRAAGMNPNTIEIIILNNRDFNAFVADGRRIFINMGTILDTQTPNELIGILAHETGHISGGHLARLRQELERAQTSSIVALVVGAAALAAGAAAGAPLSEIGSAGTGVLAGASGVGQRTLMAYQRTEERAADLAALKYLKATSQSPKGMLDVFSRFRDQESFSMHGQDPYLRSHPMAQERLNALGPQAQQSPFFDKSDPASLQLKHDLVRAKIYGFFGGSSRFGYVSNSSLVRDYEKAYRAYAQKNYREVLDLSERLIKVQPQNPYFYEIKGQALLDMGHADDAVQTLGRAVKLAGGNSALIRGIYGHALISTGNPQHASQAITQLNRAINAGNHLPLYYRLLAMAYSKTGDEGLARLTTAQAAYHAGDIDGAKSHAARAKQVLKPGSPGYIKASDILEITPPAPQRR